MCVDSDMSTEGMQGMLGVRQTSGARPTLARPDRKMAWGCIGAGPGSMMARVAFANAAAVKLARAEMLHRQQWCQCIGKCKAEKGSLQNERQKFANSLGHG